MILVYEPWAHEWMHYQFNKNFLEALLLAHKGKPILYYGSQDQILLLQKEIKYENLTFVPIQIPDYTKDSKLVSLHREFLNIKLLSKLTFDTLYITQSLPHTMLFIKLFIGRYNIVFVLHGILENLLKKNKFYQLNYYCRFALKYKQSTRYKYLVLGESIRCNLVKLLPKLTENVVSINHPYSIIDNKAQKEIYNNAISEFKFSMGSVGIGLKEKGFLSIFEVERFLQNNKISNISLSHIGRVDLDLNIKTDVNIPSTNKTLNQSEYEKYVYDLDYVLFFYPKDSYKLTASGAIFDAIMNAKPIIALKNDYFVSVFNEMGNIGYLCDSIEQMNALIYEISNYKKIDEYKAQVQNIKANRYIFTPEYISNKILENTA